MIVTICKLSLFHLYPKLPCRQQIMKLGLVLRRQTTFRGLLILVSMEQPTVDSLSYLYPAPFQTVFTILQNGRTVPFDID